MVGSCLSGPGFFFHLPVAKFLIKGKDNRGGALPAAPRGHCCGGDVGGWGGPWGEGPATWEEGRVPPWNFPFLMLRIQIFTVQLKLKQYKSNPLSLNTHVLDIYGVVRLAPLILVGTMRLSPVTVLSRDRCHTWTESTGNQRRVLGMETKKIEVRIF